MRDLSHDVIDHMRAHLQRKIENIGVTTRTRITLEPLFVVDPTPASGGIQEVIVESCRSLGLSFTHLPSRASHDAQEIGRLAPMGMIFVPSQRGISHSAEEYTSPQQCAEGVQVLLESLVRLDRQLR
jgi:N-carbamoyl-L-amino-acid hydrolase